MLREIIKAGQLPDYDLVEEEGDIIRVTPKSLVEDIPERAPVITPDALEEARRLIPGVDVYALEADWRAMWLASGKPSLRSPDKAFLGWVKKRG
jgi:hypothetical protein